MTLPSWCCVLFDQAHHSGIPEQTSLPQATSLPTAILILCLFLPPSPPTLKARENSCSYKKSTIHDETFCSLQQEILNVGWVSTINRCMHIRGGFALEGEMQKEVVALYKSHIQEASDLL